MAPSDQAAVRTGTFEFRSPGRHLLAGLIALLVSVGLHVALVRLVPPLPVGKPPALEELPRLRSFELQEVRRGMVERLERPPVYHPANPEEFIDLSVEQTAFEDALEEVLPPEPELDAGPLLGEKEALFQPQPETDRADWEPRQDILQIQEEIWSPEVSVLPRRYVSPAARTARAPDITLPAEEIGADELAPVAGALASAKIGAEGGPGGAGMPPRRGLTPSDRLPDPTDEAADLLDESPEDVTTLAPVENLLHLNVFTYTTPADPDHVYFKLQIRRLGPEALPVLPKDVLIIQDCSESMTQRKLDACKKGVQRWLDRLNPGDRFDLMGFSDAPYLCFNRWAEPTAAHRARANWFVAGMESRGRTDVYASLEKVLNLARDPNRPVIAVLITDGRPTTGVVDSSEIIEGFTTRNQGGISMFAFGGGQRVNRYLLDLLSYKNRGESFVVAEREDIPDGLADWAVQLSRPVLFDLRFRFSGVNDDDVFPKTLTHLYLDRPLQLFGRVNRDDPAAAFQIVGRSGETSHDMVFPLAWGDAQPTQEDLRQAWAWQKAYFLVGEHVRTRDPSLMNEIRLLEMQYGFLIPYGGEYPTR